MSTETEITGTILRGIGSFYTVLDNSGAEYTVRAQGKFRHERLKPLPGDIVDILPGDGESDGWITSIHSRRTLLDRPAVANIDTLVAVAASTSPEPDPEVLDKLFLSARKQGIQVYLVINKTDLFPDTAEKMRNEYAVAADRIFALSVKNAASADTSSGAAGILQALSGHIAVLAGQSGVGKTSLINLLLGLERETGDLSLRIERGKNTTRHCELLPLPGGGMIADTPGFSMIDSELMPPEEIGHFYPEFTPYLDKCYFPDCCHVSEPGCVIREAVGRGEIDRARYDRYKTYVADARLRWKNRYN